MNDPNADFHFHTDALVESARSLTAYPSLYFPPMPTTGRTRPKTNEVLRFNSTLTISIWFGRYHSLVTFILYAHRTTRLHKQAI